MCKFSCMYGTFFQMFLSQWICESYFANIIILRLLAPYINLTVHPLYSNWHITFSYNKCKKNVNFCDWYGLFNVSQMNASNAFCFSMTIFLFYDNANNIDVNSLLRLCKTYLSREIFPHLSLMYIHPGIQCVNIFIITHFNFNYSQIITETCMINQLKIWID